MSIEKIRYIGPKRREILREKGIRDRSDLSRYINSISPEQFKKELFNLTDQQYYSILYDLRSPRFLLRVVPSFDNSISLTDILLFVLGLIVGYWLNEKAASELRAELRRIESHKKINESQIDSLNSQLLLWQALMSSSMNQRPEKMDRLVADMPVGANDIPLALPRIGVISSTLEKNRFELSSSRSTFHLIDFNYYLTGAGFNYFAAIERSITGKYALLFNINLSEELRTKKLLNTAISLNRDLWYVGTMDRVEFEGIGRESRYYVLSRNNLFGSAVGEASVFADVDQVTIQELLKSKAQHFLMDSLSWSWIQ